MHLVVMRRMAVSARRNQMQQNTIRVQTHLQTVRSVTCRPWWSPPRPKRDKVCVLGLEEGRGRERDQRIDEEQRRQGDGVSSWNAEVESESMPFKCDVTEWKACA
eukprot:3543599-Rhodomonas_salina.5